MPPIICFWKMRNSAMGTRDMTTHIAISLFCKFAVTLELLV